MISMIPIPLNVPYPRNANPSKPSSIIFNKLFTETISAFMISTSLSLSRDNLGLSSAASPPKNLRWECNSALALSYRKCLVDGMERIESANDREYKTSQRYQSLKDINGYLWYIFIYLKNDTNPMEHNWNGIYLLLSRHLGQERWPGSRKITPRHSMYIPYYSIFLYLLGLSWTWTPEATPMHQIWHTWRVWDTTQRVVLSTVLFS